MALFDVVGGSGGIDIEYVDENYGSNGGSINFSIDTNKQYFVICQLCNSQSYASFWSKSFLIKNGAYEVVRTDPIESIHPDLLSMQINGSTLTINISNSTGSATIPVYCLAWLYEIK